MKKNSGKFFVVIGILLIIAGLLLYQYDVVLSILGVILGAYNTFKGIRLLRGIQPMIYRKQDEYRKKEDETLENKMKNSDSE